MQSQSFKSVWEALCDDPEEQQRTKLTLMRIACQRLKRYMAA
mgnify:CR=1 FL=1